MADDNSLFLDKLSISGAVLKKEGDLISTFEQLLSDLDQGYLKTEKLEQDENFIVTKRIISELFAFLEFNKIKEFERDKKINIVHLRGFIIKYREIEKKEQITLKEMQLAYDELRHAISRSGYHDDARMDEIPDETPEFF